MEGLMASIVEELMLWTARNKNFLVGNGIEISPRFPEPDSDVAWKASVGFKSNGVLASYTVWERTEFATELIVVNGHSGKTIAADDGNPTDAYVVHADLDGLVNRLLDGSYLRMDSPEIRQD
jgi:hypothetical protein